MSKYDVWTILNAARRHGRESDPDHEVGDLQDTVISCFSAMSEKQKATVFRELEEMLEDWGDQDEEEEETE